MQFTSYSQLGGILVKESYVHSIGFYMVETHWCSKSSWLFHNLSPWNSWFPSPNELLFSPSKCDEWTHQLSNASEFRNLHRESEGFIRFLLESQLMHRICPSAQPRHVNSLAPVLRKENWQSSDLGKGTVRRTHGSSVCSTPNASYIAVAGNDFTSQSNQII